MANVGQVTGPLVAKDRQAMQVFVPVKGDGDVVIKSVDTIHKILDRGPPAGLDTASPDRPAAWTTWSRCSAASTESSCWSRSAW